MIQIKYTLQWLPLAIILLAAHGLNYTVEAQETIQPSCSEIYTVQSNDWLSKIADKFYGSLHAYPAIITATNQQNSLDSSFAKITSPDQIETGWKLCIPAPVDAATLLTVTDTPTLPPPPPATGPYTLDDFIAEFDFGPDVDPEWIKLSPREVAQFPISPEIQEIHNGYGPRATYLWNENLPDTYYRGSLFKVVPEQIKTFRAPWKTELPRYRYPPNMTLPTGLTTNQFGWRGPPITLKKPLKTIRIAAVGASTTVGAHPYPHSYPEYLEYWLNLWAQENDYNVYFEVINAGREGLGSGDIAAVVRYEIVPMDVDYIIYYEGSNQFHPETVVSFPADVIFGQPPAGIAPNFSNVEADDKTILDRLSEYSAIAARARTVVEQFAFTGHEPPKPEQTINLPEGLDELHPNLDKVDRTLALNKILRHLGDIKQIADANDAKLLVGTFQWFAYDGMVLDPARHRNLYGYLNRVYWPISYANMRRLADFQNRVFKTWAGQNGVPIIDVAGQMPRQPDLYDDAIHNTFLGTRIRAWINFEALVPLLKADIESGKLPRPAQLNFVKHPYINDEVQLKTLGNGQ